MKRHLKKLEKEVSMWQNTSVHPPPLWRNGIPVRKRGDRTRS
jgi:hypothetical protein